MNEPKQPNQRRRSNSSNSLYLRDSIAKPDTEKLWNCIAILIKNLMDIAGNTPGNSAPKFSLFDQMYPNPPPPCKKVPVPSTSVDEILKFLKKLYSN